MVLSADGLDTKLTDHGRQASDPFNNDLPVGLSIKSCKNQPSTIDAYTNQINSKKIRFGLEMRKMR